VHRYEQYSVPNIRNLEESYFYINTEHTVNPNELQSNELASTFIKVNSKNTNCSYLFR
jgi:hypothetical protein